MSTNSTGQVKKVHMNLNEPIKMKTLDIELSEIVILAGKNGIGKSFMLKTIWAIAMCMKIAIDNISMSPFKVSLEDAAQFVFDNSFRDQNFGMENYEITRVSHDDEAFYYHDSKGQKKNLDTLSSGEQAIINMLISSKLLN